MVCFIDQLMAILLCKRIVDDTNEQLNNVGWFDLLMATVNAERLLEMLLNRRLQLDAGALSFVPVRPLLAQQHCCHHILVVQICINCYKHCCHCIQSQFGNQIFIVSSSLKKYDVCPCAQNFLGTRVYTSKVKEACFTSWLNPVVAATSAAVSGVSTRLVCSCTSAVCVADMPRKRSAQGAAKQAASKHRRLHLVSDSATQDGQSDVRCLEPAPGPTLAEIVQEVSSHLQEEMCESASCSSAITPSAIVSSLLAARPSGFVDDEAKAYYERIVGMLHAEHGSATVQSVSATVLRRQVQSLICCTCEGFARAPSPEVRNAIMRGSASSTISARPTDVSARLLKTMNSSQRAAVLAATSQTSTLVWGPPGTGKTQVAEEIMRQWVIEDAVLLASPQQLHLATSDTNCNVDNMAERFSKGGLRVLRCGRASSIRDCNRSLTLGLPAEHRGQYRHAHVVACTAVASGGDMFDKLAFSRVLVDEAAQISEPSVLVPLTRGCKHLVQIGDFKQLPPTVQQEAALDAGLGESLFERLYHAGGAVTLSLQYRMHPDIAAFPKTQFYGSTVIQDFQQVAAPHAMTELHWLYGRKPVHFIEVSQYEERVNDPLAQGPSYINSAQVRAVEYAVEDVLRRFRPNDVGIISPYRCQIERLRDAVPAGVEVMSVDASQGQQKRIILLSTVRANKSGKVGFLGDTRRINVAFTRAQSALIVIGARATLQNEYRTWRPWLQWVDEHGVVSDWSAECEVGMDSKVA